MRKKLIQLLTLLNFKEDEIKLYLTLLKLKAATISQLVTATKNKGITTYRIVKRLVDRGFIKIDQLNNKQYICRPLSLQSIINKVHAEQRKLHRLTNSLQGLDNLLPFLDLENEDTNENIELIEGKEAFKAEYLKLPDLCKEEYLHIGNMYKLWEVAGLSYDDPEEKGFIKRRINRGTYCRIFNTINEGIEEIIKRDSQEKRTTKLKKELPTAENYLGITEKQSSLFICDKEDPKVIIIKQPELLNLHKMQFKIMWEN